MWWPNLGPLFCEWLSRPHVDRDGGLGEVCSFCDQAGFQENLGVNHVATVEVALNLTPKMFSPIK